MSALEKLFYLTGVSEAYYDYSGEHKVVPWECRLEFLKAMSCDIDNSAAIDELIFDLDARPWQSWLQKQHIAVINRSQYVDIRVAPNQLGRDFTWQIQCEDGQQFSGTIVPDQLSEVGNYVIAEIRYSARRLPLPEVPLGYHQLSLTSGDTSLQAELVVTPERCYELPVGRSWGICCQLYTLRSARNWGIGDFTDLANLVTQVAAQGAGLIGLSPLHALDGTNQEMISPYSASDRRFINPLYIDPEVVADFGESAEAQAIFTAAACQAELIRLRTEELVDYAAVRSLKYPVLIAMYQHFACVHLATESPRAALFRKFLADKGATLQQFCDFEASRPQAEWPVYRDSQFHQYLQWLAWEQVAHCQQLAFSEGMTIGLMGDLAVGATAGGAEVSGNSQLYCLGLSIGAPPDPFAANGQDWGMPAINPVVLRQTGYRHFIELLRANMHYCGALRIDHVMSLIRIWCCLPHGAGGAYLYHSLDDLLALVCLESQRNRCAVVGEDMGVVPDELRARMKETAVLSNKLFYFERTADGEYKPPADHQQDALLMVTNHDVPTLAGWWQRDDLVKQSELELLSPEDLPQRLENRLQDKKRLLAWLHSQELLPVSWQQQEHE